jgi:hypothetical protein
MFLYALIYLDIDRNSKKDGIVLRKYLFQSLAILIAVPLANLGAEINVILNMPDLGTGMGLIEALLAENLSPAAA